jgi:alpha-1,2-glucosyltransferase
MPIILNTSFAAVATVTALLVVVTLYIFNVVYEVQPLPFLDEIFHIPQAEKYCRGLFTEVSTMHEICENHQSVT